MNRRAILGGLLLAGASKTATAQTAPNAKIGVLTPSAEQFDRVTFEDTLAALGHRIARTLIVEVRSAEGSIDRLPDLARELGAIKLDLVVAVNSQGARAAVDGLPNIPVVAAIVGDPIALGLVSNLSRPAGRVTGTANMSVELTTMRLSLLQQVAPSLKSVAAFYHPDDPVAAPQLRDLSVAAAPLGVRIEPFEMRTRSDLGRAMDRVVSEGHNAVLRLAGQAQTLGPPTGKLATERGLPSMVLDRASVEAGGLMSYAADPAELWRRTASQVDCILRGTALTDIPFEQPTKFEFLVNQRAARTLGLPLPHTILARADEVIE